MRIEEDIKLDFNDVLFRPKRSSLNSRSEVDLTREFTFCNSGKSYEGIPVIAANMDGVGTIEMAKTFHAHMLGVALTKHYSLEVLKKFFDETDEQSYRHVWYSTGTGEKDREKLAQFDKTRKEKGKIIDFLCIDVANGYSEKFVDFVQQARDDYPDTIIMAGNVVTAEMTEELILSGADIVKVGIGPGSVCTTRKITGVGYPQLSAVIECADAAHGLKGHICSDGGCTCPGDVAKAIGGGADFVMLGGMLAGHDQSEGEVFEKEGQKFVRFYGMSSKDAMEKHAGGVANYRASEGKSVDVPYRGDVNDTVQEILGGVRSTCTYVGATKLKELSKRTTFIRVNRQINNIFGPA